MPTSQPAPARLVTQGGDACPVCAAPSRREIEVGAFALHRCPDCGAWSSDALARGAATSFEPRRYFENAACERESWERLLAKIPAHRLRNILDVGCGTGEFLAYLAARDPATRREAIELDPTRAAAARARDPGARIHTGDALATLSRVEGPFDLITLWDVFEHVPAPAALLAALTDRLARGGLIYLQTIHERSIVPWLGRTAYRLSGGRLRGPVRRTHEAHHLVFFTRSSLERAARDAGLRVLELWWGRLPRERMDGAAWLTGLTSLLLRAENALGGGLFVNLLLGRRE
ncbi:MAG TPA: class I SAM-dependent methyltransferase [Myxococcota bacterium]|nr:class I SAM-dependent methyltransferase [Myxococcota bacterium]